jgi:hypothetical protein
MQKKENNLEKEKLKSYYEKLQLPKNLFFFQASDLSHVMDLH